MRGFHIAALNIVYLSIVVDSLSAARFVAELEIAATGSDVTIDVPGGDLRDGIFRVGITTLTGLALSHFDTGNLIGENRGVLEFSITGFPENQQIERAYVAFPSFSTNSGSPVPIRVDGYLGDGVLSNEDFAPDNQIATFTLPNKLAPTGPVSIEVTEFVRELLSFKQLEVTHAGFTFRQLSVSGADSTLVHNLRLPDEPHAVLLIDYTPVSVPEPSGAVLAAAGAIMIAIALRAWR